VLDGDLADPAWQEAPWLSPFLPVLAWRQDPQMTTTAKIRWDERGLYVAFRCQEDRPDGMRAQITDQDNYFLLGDDNVQILIARPGEKTIIYRFVANSRQVTYDALCREHPDEYARKWDPFALDLNYASGWQCAVRVGPDAWIVEAMIPWQGLDLPTPTVGTALSLNLGRYRTQAMGERTYWAPVLEMQGDFLERMDPDLFGSVILQ
jgi:hypothetical protein